MKSKTRAYLYLLGSALLWGAAGPVIKFTLGGIDPFPFLSYRLFISGMVALIILAIIKPKLPRHPKDIAILIFYSLLATTFALGFVFLALDNTTVLEAGLVGAVGPLVVVLGGAIFLGEKISKGEKRGIAIAITGTLLTVIAPVILDGAGVKISGNILLLAFLATDAASVLIAKSMMKHRFEPIVMTSIAFIIGAITIIPFTIATYGLAPMINSVTTLPVKYHLGVWYMALASGTIAYFLFIKGEHSLDAGRASLFAYLQPLFSIPLAIFWLGEVVTPVYIAGAAVIGIGVYMAETSKR